MRRFAYALTLTAALTSPPVLGQTLQSISPFVGSDREGFESYAVSSHACLKPTPFQERHTICGLGANPTLAIRVDTGISLPGFGCVLAPHGGARLGLLTPSLSGGAGGADLVDLAFRSPIERFGGYFATLGNAGPPDFLRVEFFDDALVSLGSVTETVAGCGWTWLGWESSGAPFSRVRIDVSSNLGVVVDDLEIDCSSCVGSLYCVSERNSSGQRAWLTALGSSSVAANDLELSVGPLPSGSNAILFFGPGKTNVPFVNGRRCVQGPVRRLRVASSSAMHAQVAFDLSVAPGNLVLPGSTWQFQTWFPDPAQGPAFANTSAATSITFVP